MNFKPKLSNLPRSECRIYTTPNGGHIVIPGTREALKDILRVSKFFPEDGSGFFLEHNEVNPLNIDEWGKYTIVVYLTEKISLLFYQRGEQLHFSYANQDSETWNEDPEVSMDLMTHLIDRNRFLIKVIREFAYSAPSADPSRLLRLVPVRHWQFMSDVAESAVKHNPDIISCVDFDDQKYVSGRLYQSAVTAKGSLLRCVPEERRDHLLCRSALMNDGGALSYVPEHYRLEYFELALNTTSRPSEVLRLIPRDLLKVRSDWCLKAASKSDGRVLPRIPRDNLTKTLIEAAVRAHPLELEYVPERFMDHDLLYKAVFWHSGTGSVPVKLIPERLLTEDLLVLMATIKGDVLKELYPEGRRTQKVCHHAVRQNGLALAHVPLHVRTAEICATACSQNEDAWFFVPEDKLGETLQILGVPTGKGTEDVGRPSDKRIRERLKTLRSFDECFNYLPGEPAPNESGAEAAPGVPKHG